MVLEFLEKNITDWLSAIANCVMAIVALYAAVKVKNVIKDKNDEKVYSILENFFNETDQINGDLKKYEWFFPFKLSEPVEQWDNNPDVKKKIEQYLDFTDEQCKKIKNYYHLLNEFNKKIQQLGWKINKKAFTHFIQLENTVFKHHINLSEYNCLTAKLFEIDRQYIAPSMFLYYENLSWDDKFNSIDKNLTNQIVMVTSGVNEIYIIINKIESLHKKRKFISRA